MPKYHNVVEIKRQGERAWSQYLAFLEAKQLTQEALTEKLEIEYPDRVCLSVDPIYDLHIILVIGETRAKYHWDDFVRLLSKTEEDKMPDWSTLRKIKEENL